MVADSLVPPGGRTVKCGKCANQWFVNKEADAGQSADFAALTAQAYAEAEPQPHDPKRLPAIPGKPVKAWPFQVAAGVLAASWLVIAIYAYFPGWHAGMLSGLYSSLGVTDTSDLVFADVAMEREDMEGRTRFLLSGAVANQGSQPRLLPTVRVEVKDDEGKVIWGQKYPVGETIQPGQVYPFRIDNVETSFANRAASIVLDMGNTFELVMR